MLTATDRFDLLALALDSANGTFIDHVVAPANLRRALKRVVANAGAPGTDGETVRELAASWPEREGTVRQQLLDGTYEPAPIRRVPVPKPGGKGPRMLGIPTVLDRTVQLAIAQPLSALFDPHFSPFSFGFRPGRSAHDALLQAAQFIEGGLTWVLHLDLDKFFDRAAHDLVLARLSDQVNSARLLELVRRFLTAPFAQGKRMLPRSCGLPQGGPLSPLLANLLLDELDRRISDAGFAFCRYADDICLFCVSAARAREAYATIAPWIEVDLKLVINREKTRIVRAWDDEFLGHEMRCRRGRIAFRPSATARLRLRGAVRRLLARHRIHNPGELIGAALMPLVKGWLLYFRLCDDSRLFAAIDRWTIKTVRQWLFQRAQDPRRRARILIKRGVGRDLAWLLVRKSTPETEAADCPAVQRAFPVMWLRRHGWNSCCDTPTGAVTSCPEEVRSSPDSVRLSADLDCCVRSCGLYEWPLRAPMES